MNLKIYICIIIVFYSLLQTNRGSFGGGEYRGIPWHPAARSASRSELRGPKAAEGLALARPTKMNNCHFNDFFRK